MPYKMVGSCRWYSHLTAAEEREFWHKQKDSVGIPITPRDDQAVRQGKKVTVQERPSAISASSAPSGAPRRNEVTRSEELREMRDKGLITDVEYEQKRKEILTRF